MRRTIGVFTSLALGVLLWTACGTGESPTEPGLADHTMLASVTQHCPAGGDKTEVDDVFSNGTQSFPYYVGSVCVKAGNVVHSTSYDGYFGNGCYKVYGLGTKTVTLKETGYEGCKDVSYAVAYKKSYAY